MTILFSLCLCALCTFVCYFRRSYVSIYGIVLGARMLHCFVGNVRNLIKSGFLLCVHIKLNNTKCREWASEREQLDPCSLHPVVVPFMTHSLKITVQNFIYTTRSPLPPYECDLSRFLHNHIAHTHTLTRALNSTLSYAWCISIHSALMHSKLNCKSISFRNVYYTLDLSAFFCIEI